MSMQLRLSSQSIAEYTAIPLANALTSVPPNEALHADGAHVPGCALHSAPRVSAKPLGG